MSARNGQVVHSPEREVISYEFDDFRLDVRKEELLRNGDRVALTHKAFQVLLVLAEHSKQTVEKETLYRELWADSFVEDANLTQYIYILRKTLGKDPSGEPYIETVARVGYRFRAEVVARQSRIVSLPDRSTANGPDNYGLLHPVSQIKLKSDSVLETKTEMSKERPWAASRVYPNRKYILFAGSAACLILMTIAAVFLLWTRNRAIPDPAPGKSLAVLPLKPIGEESNNEKLGLGMADAIITRLSKVEQIQVRPTSSILRYTDRPAANSRTAAREMGVDTVLEGTIQRDESRVRVSVQLIDAATGKALWADNFDENFTNIFLVQDSISDKVVRALEINLTRQQEGLIADRPTNNTEAFQAYQMGVYFFGTRTKDSLLKALDHFNKAIELDPNFAKAYAMLADTYNMLGYYRFIDPGETRPKALTAVNKAFELNDSLPEAYIARASLQDMSEEGQAASKQLLERAIELSPYNSTAHIRYGWILFPDDVDGSLRQMRLAQEYDPLSPVSNGALCNVLVFKNQYQEAIKYGEKAAELAPGSANIQMLLSTAYFLDGRSDDAIEQIKKGIAEASGVEKEQALGTLGHYYAKIGQRKEAETILGQLKRSAGQRPILFNDLALISYALDRRNEGFGYFKKAYDQHVLSSLMLRYDPVWKDVTSDARVTSLLEQNNS